MEEQMVVRGQTALRRGYTTGSCAAAAAQAAAQLLLTGQAPAAVRLETPAGITLLLTPEDAHLSEDGAVCAVRKDSGDDPDVTHGACIYARVTRAPHGVTITGGKGVGVVTRPGLACAVGQPAINPGPRAQITAAVGRAAAACGYSGGFAVEISVPQGEALAAQTYNAHLGVLGGISILGTSGIVEPMSETALMETTHLELRSLYAAGRRIAFLCPGNYGADFARDQLGLELAGAVKCSNFIGDAIDYAIYLGFPEILLVGHAGKLVKLAAGVMNTHSSVADGRQEVFTAHAALCGAPRAALEALMQAVTVDACLEILDGCGLRGAVLARIGQAIEQRLARRVRGRARIEYLMFTNPSGVLTQSPGAMALCRRSQE